MLILGIDTSCDDTSASLLDVNGDRAEIVTNVVSSQEAVHSKYGGIVPELASRRHIESIWPVVSEALAERDIGDIDAVSVCYGPGLIGSLLVGCSFAKSMCYASGIPLVAVNHLEGHLLSPFLSGNIPVFPFLSLIVSGGHTSLHVVEGYCNYRELGRTRDDAAGEAFDKVSKLLGLGYPGGPEIDKLSKDGDPKAIALPRAYMPDTFDFSFSGVKTAVRLLMDKSPATGKADVAASFQASVVDVLVNKCESAMDGLGLNSISLSGGVAANSTLRATMVGLRESRNASVYLPSIGLCTDNAAMIALAGYHRFVRGEISGMDMNPKAYLPL